MQFLLLVAKKKQKKKRQTHTHFPHQIFTNVQYLLIEQIGQLF